ncbi:MAG: PAS domain S-box protein, partial [Gallionellaceae bacterium]
MTLSVNTLLNQIQKTSTLLVLGVSAVWILFAWGIADHFLTSQLQSLINVEKAALERQSATVAEAVGQHLAQLHGAAQVVANEAAAIKTLTLADVKKIPTNAPVEQKRRFFETHPVLASSNLRLASLASTLGVEVAYVMDADGNCIAASNATQAASFVGANYGQRDYFKSAMAGKNGYQYAVGSVSKIPGLYFSAPIFSQGRIVGVAAAKLNVSKLVSWIDQADAMIADENGIVILASDRSFEMRALPNSKIANLSESERKARYRQSDFVSLALGQWRTPAFPELQFFTHERVPLILHQREMKEEGLSVYVMRRVHFAVNFAERRMQLSLVLALLGVAIIAGIQFWILLLRKREDLVAAEHAASARLNRLVNRAPGMVFEYQLNADGSSHFPYASEAVREIYRCSPEEVSEDATKVFDIIHPSDLQGVAESIQLSARELSLWRHEYRVKFEEGEVRWLQGNALPIRQEDGSVLWNGFIMDVTEQKALDAELNESLTELKLRDAALSKVSQGVTISGVDRLITYVNAEFEKITGYSSAEMLGKSTVILQGADTSAKTIAKIHDLLSKQQPFFGEILNYRKDGTPFWNELSIEPVFDVRGELSQFVAVQRDVTERVRAREELRLKEFALNAAANAIVITDTQGRLEWANAAFSSLSGYELKEAQGEVVGQLLKSGLQADDFYREMWQVILSKQVWSGELLNRRKDRTLYWEEMSIAPLVSDAGEVIHFVAVKQDISKRKALERDMLEAKDNMQGLLNAMAEGVFAVDALGQSVFVNRAFGEVLGYAENEISVGRRMFDVIGHSNVDGTPFSLEECKWMRVLSTQQPINVEHEIFRRKDGVALSVEYWAHPIVKSSVVVGVIVTFVDITQRVLIKAEQVRMSGQLLKQNRLLQQYSEQVKEEEAIARDFIQQFSAMDKISDPLVQFMLKPAANFSGDIVAFARTPDNRLHVLMADSAGHGLTAALAVIPITQPFYQMTAKGFDIPSIAKEMNRRVRDYLPLPRYVACVLISVDVGTQSIQVWNGGCPSVVMVDASGRFIEHRFQSKHLPLGVVKPELFSAQVEHLSYEGGACQLLSCSDGVTEMISKHRGFDGYDMMMMRARGCKGDSMYDRLIQVVQSEMVDQEQSDDITLVAVHCPVAQESSEKKIKLAPAESALIKEFASWELLQAGEPIWEYKVMLTTPQLKRLDVVPFLMGITSQMDGEQANGKIFVVLSEL